MVRVPVSGAAVGAVLGASDVVAVPVGAVVGAVLAPPPQAAAAIATTANRAPKRLGDCMIPGFLLVRELDSPPGSTLDPRQGRSSRCDGASTPPVQSGH